MAEARPGPLDPGQGLVLRWSTPEDTERIAGLVGRVFRPSAEEPPAEDAAAYARSLMGGRSPLTTPLDFALVEDGATGRLVSCACLLRQTWRYDGLPFPVGRPEFVATDPGFRNRGLVRATFGLLHARSEGRGDLAQVITGIPHFYRQFGYEYALDLGGSRLVMLADIPLSGGATPAPYRLRPAGEADIPFLAALYERATARSVVSSVISPEYWRYKLTTRPTSDADWQVHLIVGRDNTPVGYVQMVAYRDGPAVTVRQLETVPEVGLAAVAFPLLRDLRSLAPTIPTHRPLDPPQSLSFQLGRDHPFYDVLGRRFAPRWYPPYAWYVRVPHLAAWLRHVAPALERRLAGSVVAGYDGELRLDFYRHGLRLVFARGALTQVDAIPSPGPASGTPGFPPLVFLQLAFGYRDLDALRAAFPDVHCPEDQEPLLRALFPPAPSNVLPLD